MQCLYYTNTRNQIEQERKRKNVILICVLYNIKGSTCLILYSI
jgi:hypothetical protein